MVSIIYHGVHQAYQLALASEEAGLLDRFYCSLFDSPGKWGRLLSLVLGEEALCNRRMEGLPGCKVVEHPWPELMFKFRQRVQKLPSNAWIQVAHDFDTWAAKHLEGSASRLVVAAENCAWRCFRVAAANGLGRVYDCPGVNADILRETTLEAAKQTGLPFVSKADTKEISRRKEEEISRADVVLTYSEFHAQGVAARGVAQGRIRIIPLWTDPSLWRPRKEGVRRSAGPLRVLFAGGINLRKGVPFLLEAVRNVAPHAVLTLVGSLDPDAKACLTGTEEFAKVVSPVSKEKLRDMYWKHDVLVLPSLGDSFGFVAMEAMACGLPVILTTHCGAPVPDDSWRVNVMDAKAIEDRLREYLDRPEYLEMNGLRARNFASTFTPERYRKEVAAVFKEFLGA